MRQAMIPVLLLVSVFCIQNRAAAEKPLDVKELKQAKVQAAREAIRGLDEMLKAGRLTLSDDVLTTWSKRLLEAELALCEKKADRLAAYEKHLKYMRELENLFTEAYKAGTRNIVSVKEAQFGRLEAELWLAEAKTK